MWFVFSSFLENLWILFHSKELVFHNFTFCSICFYYALNILTTLYRIGSWNTTKTYLVQCRHNLKVCLSGVKTMRRCATRIFTGQERFLRVRAFQKTFHHQKFFFLRTLKIVFKWEHKWTFNPWMNTSYFFHY